MKTFIFIPDTTKKAGLGHLFRCFKYSNFVKKNYIIAFLINENFNKKFLIDRNLNGIKIKYIFYSSINSALVSLSHKYKNIITFVDTYNSKIHKIDFKKISNKHISILDFKIKSDSDFIIDHAFDRKINFYETNKNQKVSVGLKNFPVFQKVIFSERNLILINFGSVKNKLLIKKSLLFLKNLKLNKLYKIIIIDKYISKKYINSFKLKNRIIHYKFVKNIEEIYKNTFFSIGACGISLYEKCFFKIPSIVKSVAKNQSNNFKSFYSKGCILDFNKIIKLNGKKTSHSIKFFKEINKTENAIKMYFNYKKNKNYLYKLFNKF